MIWRPSRPTRVRSDVPLPGTAQEGVLVGALGLSALRELAVWRRLVATSLPEVPLRTILVSEAWRPKDRRSAESAFAPSELAEVEFVEDAKGAWRSLLDGEAVFAAAVTDGAAKCLILGGPTDEAWDRLEGAAKNLNRGTGRSPS